MNALFKGRFPDFAELENPKTPEDAERARLMRDHYKLDPSLMRLTEERYGPLEWRMPEAHAIYWAVVGLQNCPTNHKDLITLRRMIYQSMHQTMLRGKIYSVREDGAPVILPNIDVAFKVDRVYEEMIRDDEEKRYAIQQAHKNFLREAVYFLYSAQRLTDAGLLFDKLKKTYPGAINSDIKGTKIGRAHV